MTPLERESEPMEPGVRAGPRAAWGASVGAGVVVAVVCFVLTFVLKLGYVLPAVWLVGTLGAAWLGRRRGGWAGAGLAALGYALGTAALFGALVDRQASERFEMSWHEEKESGESVVALEFVRAPGNRLLFRSHALLTALRDSGSPRVTVTIEITRDLGCVRGFHETRIGPIDDPRVLDAPGSGYEVANGAAPPWPDPWWCR